MKQAFIVTGIIILMITTSYGQEKKKFFADEVSLSVNRSLVDDDNTEGKLGYGLGVYHLFSFNKQLDITLGAEFNHTRQLKKIMYEGHFAHETDMTYSSNFLSIPVGIRMNFKKKYTFFVEAGGFADINIRSNKKGILHTYYPDEYYRTVYKTENIDETASFTSFVGLQFGAGIIIPVYKYELVIRPEYKFALNKFYSHQDDIFDRYLKLNIGLRLN